MQTPYRADDTVPSPQKPLDPVILSFDRKEELEGEGTSSDEDDLNLPPSSLYAPPTTNLQERAYRYRLEDEPSPSSYRHGVNTNRNYTNAQESSEIDES